MIEAKQIFEVVKSKDLKALKQYISAIPKALGEINEEGIPALHLLVRTGNLEMVKFAIEYSIVNPCIVDGRGNTILHYAVESGNLDLVKYLVERVGVPIDRANLLGETPFDVAHNRVKYASENYALRKKLVESELPDENKLPGESELSEQKKVSEQGKASEERENICEYFRQVLGCTMDEMYHNPIRRGMHPDPSIVRVGEDYYMVNSSFMFFPCIPISHSKDLLHWEVIGHAITNPEWARLKDLEGGRGYWAPDISYYEGKFYITATYRLNDGGEKLRYQMVTSSEKPEGPYCEPVFLDEDGIDPSIFTDVDGRRYMLLNRGARIFEISPDGRKILSEPKLLWYGHNQKASEGPHLLYKDGYYYLFMAEGGTGMGHRISVARSKSLMGVYEPCPYNPILRQWDEERQLQCCGHGKPVQTAEGDWYMVYLCYRPGATGYGILGRETAMDPITWTADGWPIVNSLKGPSDLQRKPAIKPQSEFCSAEEFTKERIAAERPAMERPAKVDVEYRGSTLFAPNRGYFGEWSTVRGTEPGSYEEADGKIVIHGNGLDLNTLDYGTILVKPQTDFSFEMRCRVSVEALHTDLQAVGDWDAGLTCYYDENSYLKLALAQREGKVGILVAEYVDDRYVTKQSEALPEGALSEQSKALPEGALSEQSEALSEETMRVQSKALPEGTVSVELRIVTRGLERSSYYRVDKSGEESCTCGKEDNSTAWKPVQIFENTSYLSSEGLSKGKRFTGAMAGIYVHGKVTAAFGNVEI